MTEQEFRKIWKTLLDNDAYMTIEHVDEDADPVVIFYAKPDKLRVQWRDDIYNKVSYDYNEIMFTDAGYETVSSMSSKNDTLDDLSAFIDKMLLDDDFYIHTSK